MKIKDGVFFGHWVCQNKEEQEYRQHSDRFRIKIMQVNIVEEWREWVSIVFACEMEKISFIKELFSIKRVKYEQQKNEYTSCE